MTARITIERILRDDDDMTGRDIREWKLCIEGGHVTIKPRDGLDFILLRSSDIGELISDLARAQTMANEDAVWK